MSVKGLPPSLAAVVVVGTVMCLALVDASPLALKGAQESIAESDTPHNNVRQRQLTLSSSAKTKQQVATKSNVRLCSNTQKLICK